jgi:hypothetical protein
MKAHLVERLISQELNEIPGQSNPSEHPEPRTSESMGILTLFHFSRIGHPKYNHVSLSEQVEFDINPHIDLFNCLNLSHHPPARASQIV